MTQKMSTEKALQILKETKKATVSEALRAAIERAEEWQKSRDHLLGILSDTYRTNSKLFKMVNDLCKADDGLEVSD